LYKFLYEKESSVIACHSQRMVNCCKDDIIKIISRQKTLQDILITNNKISYHDRNDEITIRFITNSYEYKSCSINNLIINDSDYIENFRYTFTTYYTSIMYNKL